MSASRAEILERLRKKAGAGQPIVGGVDFLVVHNSCRFRISGSGPLAGMLPFGDANAIVLATAREVLPAAKGVPVLAGVCGTDPMRLMDKFLEEVKESGFAGVQNFPTVGLIDGVFRKNLEETELGYGREVEMIRLARGLDLLTAPYVFTPEDAVKMAEAGADLLVAHLGLATRKAQERVERVAEIAKAGRKARGDVLVLSDTECEGTDGFLAAEEAGKMARKR